MNADTSILVQLVTAGDAGELDQFDALLHDNVIVHAPLGLSTVGREAERESWRRAKAAMPDLRHDVKSVLRDGTFESARCVVTGTLTGEYGGLRADGVAFQVDQGLFAQIQDGKIVELWEIVDTEPLLTKLRAANPA